MMTTSSAVQLPCVVLAAVTSHTNCDLKQIEAETPRPLSSENTRSAHCSHMPDRAL